MKVNVNENCDLDVRSLKPGDVVTYGNHFPVTIDRLSDDEFVYGKEKSYHCPFCLMQGILLAGARVEREGRTWSDVKVGDTIYTSGYPCVVVSRYNDILFVGYASDDPNNRYLYAVNDKGAYVGVSGPLTFPSYPVFSLTQEIGEN